MRLRAVVGVDTVEASAVAVIWAAGSAEALISAASAEVLISAASAEALTSAAFWQTDRGLLGNDRTECLPR